MQRTLTPSSPKTDSKPIDEQGLSILTLNVCGLKSKLQDEVFLEECSNYDILCFTETKLDDTDKELIEERFEDVGFKCVLKNRRKYSNIRSGGILIAYKYWLGKFYTKSKLTVQLCSLWL